MVEEPSWWLKTPALSSGRGAIMGISASLVVSNARGTIMAARNYRSTIVEEL